MSEKEENEVNELIAKATRANDSGDALKFSQAACNVANALCALATAKTSEAALRRAPR
jgi:hypothetical protein